MVSLKKAQKFFEDETLHEYDEDNTYDNEPEPEDELESESDPEEMLLEEPSKNAIYNRDGLLEKLEDIAWPDNIKWIHKLTIDIDQEQTIDVHDDLSRELAFYTQALQGTKQAFEQFQSMGLPFLRPPDYYAEMVKTDAHMLKVKEKLLLDKQQIEEAELRKKQREDKKIAKEVQAQKTKERAKRKKEEIESVKKWRKQRQQNGFPRRDGEEMDFNFNDRKGSERSAKRRPGVAPGDRSGGLGKKGVKGNKKRSFRESKFGHGGRKGMKKQNTAETTSDLRGFNKGEGKNRKRG